MSDELSKRDRLRAAYIARLVKETGISEKQANHLIELLGFEWAPLVREAKNHGPWVLTPQFLMADIK